MQGSQCVQTELQLHSGGNLLLLLALTGATSYALCSFRSAFQLPKVSNIEGQMEPEYFFMNIYLISDKKTRNEGKGVVGEVMDRVR